MTFLWGICDRAEMRQRECGSHACEGSQPFRNAFQPFLDVEDDIHFPLDHRRLGRGAVSPDDQSGTVSRCWVQSGRSTPWT